MHSAFALQAGNSQFLQLGAVDRVGEIEHFVVGKLGFFFRSAGVAGQPQEHRRGAAIAFRRMAAPVLQMAILAGPLIEQRTKPIRCLRR